MPSKTGNPTSKSSRRKVIRLKRIAMKWATGLHVAEDPTVDDFSTLAPLFQLLDKILIDRYDTPRSVMNSNGFLLLSATLLT